MSTINVRLHTAEIEAMQDIRKYIATVFHKDIDGVTQSQIVRYALRDTALKIRLAKNDTMPCA